MMPVLKRRILVAGGSGFLGTNLCRALLKEGHEVTVLDNFSRESRANLEHLSDFDGLKVLEQDVADPLSFKALDFKANDIYNMACAGGAKPYHEDRLSSVRTRSNGVGNLLTLAHRNRARILQSSTHDAYEKPVARAQDETTRHTETLCMDFHRTYGVDVKIARIFNSYGPFMQPHDGRVISHFITQALLNRPITIYGDGSQTRSFCYVDDLIDGLRALMDAPLHIDGPINFGHPIEVTILELAEMIIALVGCKSSVIFEVPTKDNSFKYQPDISRAEKLLGWAPKIDLEEGLIRTITYFESVLQRDYASAAMANSHFSLNRQLAGSGEFCL
jgi:UDP-glucuronate decarboxylase